MERISRLYSLFTLLLIGIIVYIISKKLLFAFIVFFISGLLINFLDLFLSLNKLKKNKYISIGNNKHLQWKIAIGVLFGISLFLYSLLFAKDDTEYKGFNFYSIFGILFIYSFLSLLPNSKVLLKKRTFVVLEFLHKNEIKYKKLKSFVINNDSIEIKYGGNSKMIGKFSDQLTVDEIQYLNNLINFLRPRIGEKLVIINNKLSTTQK